MLRPALHDQHLEVSELFRWNNLSRILSRGVISILSSLHISTKERKTYPNNFPGQVLPNIGAHVLGHKVIDLCVALILRLLDQRDCKDDLSLREHALIFLITAVLAWEPATTERVDKPDVILVFSKSTCRDICLDIAQEKVNGVGSIECMSYICENMNIRLDGVSLPIVYDVDDIVIL